MFKAALVSNRRSTIWDVRVSMRMTIGKVTNLTYSIDRRAICEVFKAPVILKSNDHVNIGHHLISTKFTSPDGNPTSGKLLKIKLGIILLKENRKTNSATIEYMLTTQPGTYD